MPSADFGIPGIVVICSAPTTMDSSTCSIDSKAVTFDVSSKFLFDEKKLKAYSL